MKRYIKPLISQHKLQVETVIAAGSGFSNGNGNSNTPNGNASGLHGTGRGEQLAPPQNKFYILRAGNMSNMPKVYSDLDEDMEEFDQF